MEASAGQAPVPTMPRGRCRCGHYPTDHMVTRPIPGSASFRLEVAGPCAICGEATCRAYTPAGSAPPDR